MSGSALLRGRDVRAIWQLVGECRELGDDRLAWRDHWVAGLAELVDADLGIVGEMAGCHTLGLRDLGVTFWWQLDLPAPSRLHPNLAQFRSNPRYSPAMLEYHRLNRAVNGVCLSRVDFIEDRDWFRSDDYQLIHESFGTNATLWCFRQLAGAAPGESSGIVLIRARRRRDFSRRNRILIQEANATLTPLVGRALARYNDPSPTNLAPRVRQVLACLLQGDGDKQVASRLRLGLHTVNEYTKAIYRHFGVRSRPELLARWIRRGWGNRFAWADTQGAPSGAVVPFRTGYRARFDADHDFLAASGPG